MAADTLDFPGYVFGIGGKGLVPTAVQDAMNDWMGWNIPKKVLDTLGCNPSLLEISVCGNDEIAYKADALPTENFKGPEETWHLRAGDCEEQALFKMALINHYRSNRMDVGIMVVTYIGGPDHAYTICRSRVPGVTYGHICLLNNAHQAPVLRIGDIQKADDVIPRYIFWADGSVVLYGRKRV